MQAVQACVHTMHLSVNALHSLMPSIAMALEYSQRRIFDWSEVAGTLAKLKSISAFDHMIMHDAMQLQNMGHVHTNNVITSRLGLTHECNAGLGRPVFAVYKTAIDGLD